jgi:hypothetical protein
VGQELYPLFQQLDPTLRPLATSFCASLFIGLPNLFAVFQMAFVFG